MRNLIVIPIFLLFTLNAFSQQTISLSLEQTIDSAMANYQKIKQYREAVLEKEYMKKAATGNYFPQVSLNAGYTWFSQNPEINMSQVKCSIDDVAGRYGAFIVNELGLSDEAQEDIYNRITNGLGKLPAYNIEIDQQHFPNLDIYALQPIFTGGKIIAGRRASEAEYELSQIDFEEKSNEVFKEVVKDVHKMTLKEFPRIELYEEGSQIRRSSKSVKSNIVEGYGRRGFNKDYIRVLTYSIASNDETIDHLETVYETESLKNEELYNSIHAKITHLSKKPNLFIQAVEGG
ncbi:MAG: four helix bundle protein [Chlorobi bacterium]|nr:four helix bundle protein [Chlorobiota bacterium]